MTDSQGNSTLTLPRLFALCLVGALCWALIVGGAVALAEPPPSTFVVCVDTFDNDLQDPNDPCSVPSTTVEVCSAGVINELGGCEPMGVTPEDLQPDYYTNVPPPVVSTDIADPPPVLSGTLPATGKGEGKWFTAVMAFVFTVSGFFLCMAARKR